MLCVNSAKEHFCPLCLLASVYQIHLNTALTSWWFVLLHGESRFKASENHTSKFQEHRINTLSSGCQSASADFKFLIIYASVNFLFELKWWVRVTSVSIWYQLASTVFVVVIERISGIFPCSLFPLFLKLFFALYPPLSYGFLKLFYFIGLTSPTTRRFCFWVS